LFQITLKQHIRNQTRVSCTPCTEHSTEC